LKLKYPKMSAQPIRFDKKVVVITGSGRGLGRAYALYFASRGAKVVVNDTGCSTSGSGFDKTVADYVVSEIIKNGGEAIANYDSVEFGEKIINMALENYGKVDILINNAGILRDRSMVKMTTDDFDTIIKVHLKGTFACTKAAWDSMRKQNYGRIVNTASPAGLYGNFGQANYSAAKLGIHGLTQTLAIEGEKRNIRVNTIAPLAATRMTEGIFPAEILDVLKPEHVVPIVAYLSHDSCLETGSIMEVAGGFVARNRWQRAGGAMMDLPFSAEDIA
jgi:NAD(P)-dependent dehydrogenase (short-subunit alcohol dehydrogenase family)